MQGPYDAELIAMMAFIGAGLVLFLYMLYAQQKLARAWIILHCLAIFSNLLSIFGIVMNLIVFGRTEFECYLLNSCGGSSYHLLQGLSRLYFAVRLTLIHKMASKISQMIDFAIVFISAVFTVLNVVLFNMWMGSMIDPVAHICFYFPKPWAIEAAGMLGLGAIAIDVLINWRFITYIRSGTKKVIKVTPNEPGSSAGSSKISSNEASSSRLVKITLWSLLVHTAIKIFTTVCFAGAIPLSVGLYTVLLSFEMVINSATLIWPLIIVRFMKNWKLISTQSHEMVPSSKQRSSRVSLR